MRALFVQISGIAGVLTFLNHLWQNASVERTVFLSLAVGLSIYFVLTIGDRVIKQILSQPVPQVPEDAKVKNETLGNRAPGTPATRRAKA